MVFKIFKNQKENMIFEGMLFERTTLSQNCSFSSFCVFCLAGWSAFLGGQQLKLGKHSWKIITLLVMQFFLNNNISENILFKQ
jgi:hypothetical protein